MHISRTLYKRRYLSVFCLNILVFYVKLVDCLGDLEETLMAACDFMERAYSQVCKLILLLIYYF